MLALTTNNSTFTLTLKIIAILVLFVVFAFGNDIHIFLWCWIKSSFVDLDGWKNGWFWFVWGGFLRGDVELCYFVCQVFHRFSC
jgi:hypothetical protein